MATSIFLCGSSVLRITALYTPPNPPSPIMRARLKFFVAAFNSENVNSLRLLCLWDKIANDLAEDAVLNSETFWEFNSEPNGFKSRSVDMEVEVDRTELDCTALCSLFCSLLEKLKHFIVPLKQISPLQMQQEYNGEKTRPIQNKERNYIYIYCHH